MREDAATKAGRYLTGGCIIDTSVQEDRIGAVARRGGTIGDISFERRDWFRVCPARNTRCSHLLAVRRVVAVGPMEGAW